MFYRLNLEETKYKKYKIGNITIFTDNVCVLKFGIPIFGHRVLLRFSYLLKGFLKVSIKTLIVIILYFQSRVSSILYRVSKNLCVRLGFQRETDGQHNNNVASKKLS